MRKIPGISGEDDEQPAKSSAVAIVSTGTLQMHAADIELTK
jgi:hypothetical protein